MPRGSPGRAASIVAVAALLSLGCSDKSAPAPTDAGAAALARPEAAEAGAPGVTGVDAVLDDTAMPASSGEDLQNRMRHLLEAIAQDNPDLASDALFPRDAYVATRDSPDPRKAWDKNVSGSYRRAVGRLHKRLKGVDRAKFVSFEIGHSIVQLTPKKKEFKKPLWRVKHSKLTFTIDGKTRHLDIPEMTAWRGAWYVTRLR